jgi:hypothetical protein
MESFEHNIDVKFTSRRDYFIEENGGDIVLRDQLGTELGRGARDSQASRDYYEWGDVLSQECLLCELTPDEVVWHFLKLQAPECYWPF